MNQSLLDDLRFLGLQLSLTLEEGLEVRPTNLLTEELRSKVRTHKPELIKALLEEASFAGNQNNLPRNARLANGDRSLQLVNQKFKEAHAAYLRHHWTCRPCCAAGKRRGARCKQGQMLWTLYEDSLANKWDVEGGR
jgi:hypothetical protein